VDLGTGLATINVSANETVVCTYTNTKAAPTGRLVIEKDTIPDGPTPFTFTPTGFNSGSTFVLDDAASTPTIPNSMGFTVPAAMPLTVTETTVTGFVLSSIVCRDANGVLVPANRVSVSIPAVTVTVLENEVVTCVFTNRQQGRIIIHKDTVPNDPQDFRFETTGDGLSPFILEDDGNELVAPFNTQTFNVLPGQFSVREVLPVPGFTLASLRCSDPSGGTTTNLATGLATIGLAAGETVECFFVNTKQQPPAYGTDPKALPTERPYDPVTNGQPAGDTGQTGGAQNQPSPEPTTSQDPAAEVAGTTDALSPVADPSGGPGDSVVDTVVDPIVDAVKSQINLPRTGAELIQQAIAGLVLIGGGLVLMALRRRRSSASA
jgi:LPXTG-motif cell wall-anchored protein